MEYGKFNSAEELLKGYNELEKSFTHKCQQLAELRQQMERTTTPSGTNETSSPLVADKPTVLSEDAENKQAQVSLSANNTRDEGAAAEVQVVCAVPADANSTPAAVTSAANEAQAPENTSAAPLPKVMAGGGNVSLISPAKPRTIKEASVLAARLFED